jgi:hypothetical protein
MALIACSECGKQISDKAAACPHCGNPLAAASPAPIFRDDPAAQVRPVPVQIVKKKSNTIWWVLGTPVVLFGAMMVIGAANNGPEAQARSAQRQAIELCWQEQGKKSLDPSTGRFVAGVCEKMQADLDANHVTTASAYSPSPAVPGVTQADIDAALADGALKSFEPRKPTVYPKPPDNFFTSK